MKILLFLAALFFCQPALAAEAPAGRTAEQKDVAQPEATQAKAPETVPVNPGEYSCEYYTVKLPEGWKAIMPPKEDTGRITSIFEKDGHTSVVTLMATPSGGAEAKVFADMVAEQAKASKPEEKNGQYVFTTNQNGLRAKVWISAHGGIFLMTTIAGNEREGLRFIKNNISSEKYAALFPKQ